MNYLQETEGLDIESAFTWVSKIPKFCDGNKGSGNFQKEKEVSALDN